MPIHSFLPRLREPSIALHRHLLQHSAFEEGSTSGVVKFVVRENYVAATSW